MRIFSLLFGLLFIYSCGSVKNISETYQLPYFTWNNATVYFLLTDRFYNGDKSNDFKHPSPPAAYRGFMGGDIKGITAKINEGYFEKIGVDAIWMTPLVENISDGVDEGTGLSYGFHGYWTKDWTKPDPRFGTEKDIKEMVAAAHRRGIRILMDVVINHTGPVTASDPLWPEGWVRTNPKCTYKNYETTTACTLVDNLPDVRTESTQDVTLPPHLVDKWKQEGRYEKEVAELDAFFKKTGYPRRPYYYIIKWLTDLIRDFGINGFRVDTVKHTEEEVWLALRTEADKAFKEWKKSHPTEVLDDQPFFMVGEVYNYYIGSGRWFDFGDKKVDYFAHGFDALINFDFKYDATKSYSDMFAKYDTLLQTSLSGKNVMNYISSHDDGGPYDKMRTKTFESANRLLLSQGISQIYYGDESARSLSVNAKGDAVLRSFMNWDEQKLANKKDIVLHWQKLGQYRRNHPSIGAGKHIDLGNNLFARTYVDKKYQDVVVFSLQQPKGIKVIDVSGYFADGQQLRDAYSDIKGMVKKGKIIINSENNIVLLEKVN
jgi:alpha-amylase